MEFYIAQGLSILTCIVAVAKMQFKDMKMILAGQILSNLLSASTYLLLGGLSGGGVCIIAIFQTVTMFVYNAKKVPPHKSVIALFILLYIGYSALYYKSFIDIFSAIAAITFAMSVVQTKPALSRLWYLFNPLCWLIYDIYTKAYGNFVLHIIVFSSTLFAIIRNDIKRKA